MYVTLLPPPQVPGLPKNYHSGDQAPGWVRIGDSGPHSFCLILRLFEIPPLHPLIKVFVVLSTAVRGPGAWEGGSLTPGLGPLVPPDQGASHLAFMKGCLETGRGGLAPSSGTPLPDFCDPRRLAQSPQPAPRAASRPPELHWIEKGCGLEVLPVEVGLGCPNTLLTTGNHSAAKALANSR